MDSLTKKWLTSVGLTLALLIMGLLLAHSCENARDAARRANQVTMRRGDSVDLRIAKLEAEIARLKLRVMKLEDAE